MSGYWAGIARETRPSDEDLRGEALEMDWWFRVWCPDFEHTSVVPPTSPVERTVALARELGWREVAPDKEPRPRSLLDRITNWLRSR